MRGTDERSTDDAKWRRGAPSFARRVGWLVRDDDARADKDAWFRSRWNLQWWIKKSL